MRDLNTVQAVGRRERLQVQGLAGLACVGILTACSCSVGLDDPDQPVVVLVTLDTTRADHLGCYGSEVPGISPRIDALATEGVVFTSSISQAAVTPVSHASIFTGLNPFNHGVRVMHSLSQSRLTEEQVTIAEILADRGYETGAFVSAFPVTEYFGFNQGFDHFDESFDQRTGGLTKTGAVNTGAAQRAAGETTDLAIEWMKGRTEPFFMWLHYFDPHDDKVLPPKEELIGKKFRPGHRDRLRDIYDFEVTYMDRELGRVFDQLKSMGAWDNSVVVVTADHGEGLGDHDWWTHGVLYQEQVRVPLIVKAPGVAGGRRVDSVVRSIDILPTIADCLGLAGSDLPTIDGTSLVPLMTGEKDDLGLIAYSDSVNQMVYNFSSQIVDNKDDMLFAIVIEGRWKYIHHLRERDDSELYDLQNDPEELTNLFAEEPAIRAKANEALRQLKFMPVKQLEDANVPPEVLKALESLGYVGNESEPGRTPKDG